MQRPDLENKIHDYIKTLYKAIYKGLLLVEQEGDIYTFTIGIPSYMIPTVTNYESNNDTEFLEYIYEDLRVRNYMRLEFYKVVRTNETREE